MDIKLPVPVVATPAKVTSSADDMVKAETLSNVPKSFNKVSTVETGTDEENDEDDDDDDDWDTFQSFPASTNPEGTESKTESIAEEEPGFPESSCSIQDETNHSPLAEEADDLHLASDRDADTSREDSVDSSKEVEEETVEPSLIEEALTSENDKASSDDHLVEVNEESVESKSPESGNILVGIKLPSAEADSPSLDDLEPHQPQKSLEDDQVKSSNEGAHVVVSDKTVAEDKSDEV